MKKFIPIHLLLLLLLASCRTGKDTVAYFQDIESRTAEESPLDYALRLVPDDRLSITVSAVDPQAAAPFNMPLNSYAPTGSAEVSQTPVLHTYLVSPDGEINFPVLGKVKAAGKTREELAAQLTEALKAYINDPIVTIQLLNFKVSVLGEVQRPGTFGVPNERLSILDAIGMAGDLTIYGNRTNVLLIRESDGKRHYHHFDLTKAETLESPYFYLRQNDVVVVEANDARKESARYNQQQQVRVSITSTIISAVSVLASLVIALLVK